MQFRALVGRPRPFREIVVRPRPTATSPSTFAVAALGTATVLTATIIGLSQLGVGLAPSSHSGRILAGPPTPTSTSPFSGFSSPAPLPISIPPEAIPSVAVPPAAVPPAAVPPVAAPPDSPSSGSPSVDVPAGGAAHQPTSGSVVEAAALHPQTQAGTRGQGVTAVSAVLNVPSVRTTSKPLVNVVSVASAYPFAIVIVPPSTPPAVVVPVSKSERADRASERAAKHHSAKAKKHNRAHAKDGKATRST